MISVTPKIYFLGQPQMNMGSPDDPGVINWLLHIGGEEALTCLDHMENGSDIEQLIELMARRCYKSFAPGLNPNVKKIRENSAEYLANIAKQRHGSVVANGGMVTYAFEDVSRVFCFHPDVEILTMLGWKRAEDLVISDVLLTKSPDTGQSRWSVPRSVQRFPYAGELLYWENSQVTSPPVTPDHLLWAAPYDRYGWGTYQCASIVRDAQKIPARELFGLSPLTGMRTYKEPRPRRFVVDHAIHFSGEDPQHLKIGGNSYDAGLFLEWLGWLATDGCINKNGRTVEITQTKAKGAARLDFLFAKLFGNQWAVYGKHHRTYRLRDAELSAFCTQHIGRLKSERKFSPWLMGLSDRLLLCFWKGALGGDGSVSKRQSFHEVLYCRTMETAGQWQVILARLGRSSNIRVEISQIGKAARVVNGAMVIATLPYFIVSIHKKGASLVNNQHQKRMPYEGFL
jgi:hypothetical protein